jgi:hypothetical protein
MIIDATAYRFSHFENKYEDILALAVSTPIIIELISNINYYKNTKNYAVTVMLLGGTAFFVNKAMQKLALRLLSEEKVKNSSMMPIWSDISNDEYYTNSSDQFAKMLRKLKLDRSYVKELFNTINQTPNNSTILIDDKSGLDSILEETSKNRFREWGTVLNAEFSQEKTIITNIMNHEQALREGIVQKGGIMSVGFDKEKEAEYQGRHHYHPNILTRLFSAQNYSINTIDRITSTTGIIHLLSFNNIHKEPEIIGYDKKYTYIPKNKDDKSVLIRATHKDILEYTRRI